MMKFGILPNIPIGKDIIPPSLSSTVQGIIPPSLSSTGQGILSPSLQSGMSMTNEPSSQNTTGSVLQLATKLVEQTSYGLAGDATSNTGSTSGASTSKSSQGTSLVSQTGKVVTNILHDLTSTEGGNEVNELVCNRVGYWIIFQFESCLFGIFCRYTFLSEIFSVLLHILL